VVAILVLLGGSAGAYFGYYLPNQPDQIWKKALSNSATGYDKLNEYYDSQGEASEKGTLTGNFKVESSSGVVDGNIETKYDPVNSATKIDAGFSGVRLNAEILTNIPEGSQYPDIYAKVDGLEGLDELMGAEAGSFIEGFNDQWYFVDHTLFDQIAKMSEESETEVTAPTKEDVDAIVLAFGQVNREYIFTDDPNKAVLVRKQDVGREKLNDRDVYHYKVSYNKENLKSYTEALKNAMKNTKLKDYIGDSEFDKLTSSIDGLSGQEEADVWVDMKTKLVRQIRFTDSENQGSHMDLALNYNGGDEYPFLITIVNDEEDYKGTTNIGITLNTDTNEVKFNLDGEETIAGDTAKFNLNGTLKSSGESVEFNKPQDTKSLLEAFGGLMGDLTLSDPAELSTEINEL
jgi:hypothetical protein